MFDRDTLNELAETIVYVNLLLAILAIIALYDQRRIRTGDNQAQGNWQAQMEEQMAALTVKIEEIDRRTKALLGAREKKAKQ